MTVKPNSPEAIAWWRNLSNNQQNHYHKTYWPNLSYDILVKGYGWIQDIWEKEGNPKPQPVKCCRPNCKNGDLTLTDRNGNPYTTVCPICNQPE